MKVIELLQTVAEVHGEDYEVLNAALKWHPKVDFSDSCWHWTASTNPGGYGTFSTAKRALDETLAHRVGFALLLGDVPEGLTIDHLCRNRDCVNPDHLEAVTRSKNARRALKRRRKSKTHCANGHPWEENKTVNPSNDGYTNYMCSECKREAASERYWEDRERTNKSSKGTPETCPNGHPYIPENRSKGKHNRCLPCRNEYERRKRLEAKEQAMSTSNLNSTS